MEKSAAFQATAANVQSKLYIARETEALDNMTEDQLDAYFERMSLLHYENS